MYFEIFQAINPIGSTFHTQALKSGRSAVLQLSPPSIVVRSHRDRADNNKPWHCVHRLQYISEENLDKKVLCSLLRKRHHKQTPGNDSKNTMELLDFHRIPRLDHLLDLCYYQPHYSKLIAAASSVPARLPESDDINHDTCNDMIKALDLHPIVCSERSIDRHHSCYRLRRSVQPWILQTSKKKQHQIQVDETDHTKDFPNFDFYKLNVYKEINRLPADACNQFFNTAFDVR
ncbi:hypothetical protein Pst134EA_017389 [Puccinia striiformis f. sp. tritici]|uniref:Uncharacterized protein n=1 Tax=Puccinia striiformis f. sp. tritici PST-78 TaxID=1165861 RepID=A0A0L0VMX2_9BASI|nr:hypothetical protein Pst134EA_017389 [Puccinia striiformis f. sp. tritici]KAH9461080.1 hypothetical protein Pst134EA_017389 [Puccinia striiformis f. sp. tritici]KNF00624.1 hypothetical protein PSTG_06039 [Puccinia striiformis f. sp. tritici PST-78]